MKITSKDVTGDIQPVAPTGYDNMTQSHTPTPWEVYEDDNLKICGQHEINEVATAQWSYKTAAIFDHQGRAYNQHDAAHIVRCVNAHDDLVKYTYLESVHNDGSISQFQANEIFMKNGWNPANSIPDFLHELREAALAAAQAQS